MAMVPAEKKLVTIFTDHVNERVRVASFPGGVEGLNVLCFFLRYTKFNFHWKGNRNTTQYNSF
jgi:hypothetical protein